MGIKSVALAVGLLASGAAFTSANAAIVNGGFETGDFTGWTLEHEAFPFSVGVAPIWPVHSGNFAAQIAGFSNDPNILAQTVATTVGQSYTLSFAFYQVAANPNGLGVTWNGSSLYTEADSGTSSYRLFSFAVTGTGTDTLRFIAYNNPSYGFLDDVSLTVAAVPEPATWAMLLLGFAGLGYLGLRRKASAALPAAA